VKYAMRARRKADAHLVSSACPTRRSDGGRRAEPRRSRNRPSPKPGTPDFLFLWVYMIAYVFVLRCLSLEAVATAQRLRGPAVVVGLLGAIVYIELYVIFIH
jgi:hypothetical protein